MIAIIIEQINNISYIEKKVVTICNKINAFSYNKKFYIEIQ